MCDRCGLSTSELEFCEKCNVWLCSHHIVTHTTTKECKECKQKYCEQIFLDTVPGDSEWDILCCFGCNTKQSVLRIIKYSKSGKNLKGDIFRQTIDLMRKIVTHETDKKEIISILQQMYTTYGFN